MIFGIIIFVIVYMAIGGLVGTNLGNALGSSGIPPIMPPRPRL